MDRPIVTLTTDFGERDPYVAAMKGVILSRCPEAQVIDLTHDIAACDIFEGARFLAGAVPHFPEGSIHVAVVDPGVGTSRLALYARVGGRCVIGPDNGLVTLLIGAHRLEEARVISNPDFHREKVSATFHGRDVFAFAAGRLACGAKSEAVGPKLEEPRLLDFPGPR